MRRIEVLDKAAEAGIKYRDINVNATFGAAYFTSVDAGKTYQISVRSFGTMTLMRFWRT